MAYSLYNDYISLVNNVDDFAMAYRLFGRTDFNSLLNRYNNLSNKNSGMVVKLNNGVWR